MIQSSEDAMDVLNKRGDTKGGHFIKTEIEGHAFWIFAEDKSSLVPGNLMIVVSEDGQLFEFPSYEPAADKDILAKWKAANPKD